MCGIWASFRIDATRKVIDIVSHRGPDGDGWQEIRRKNGMLLLGHRRLAIIDTRPIGRQPMGDEEGRFLIVYNGELYNYLALRSELTAIGETFKTDTDTEVVIKAYNAWGADCLRRFHGMFAFVLFDSDKDELFVARDRFGIKPLFWASYEQGVVFSSEMKQILALPGFRRKLDVQQAYDFLAYGMLYHNDETLFDGIHQVPAAGFSVVPLAAGGALETPKFKRWYGLEPSETEVCSLAESASRVRHLLANSVAEHMVADVDIGFALSGGIDSSALTIMGRQFKSTNKTYSAVFDDPNISERPFIDQVNSAIGTNGTYVEPDGEEFVERFEHILWHQETPMTSASVFSQWAVYRAAAKDGIKVMIDGQGADEYMGGYLSILPYQSADLLRRGQFPSFFRTLVARQNELGMPIARQLLELANAMLPEKWRAQARQLRGIHTPAWMGEGFKGFASPLPETRTLNDVLLSQTLRTSLPKLLQCLDRNSMSQSIEARVPMLDADLVSYLFTLPNQHKVSGAMTKHVLRDALKDVLPRAVYQRRDKAAFASPDAAWRNGAFAKLVNDAIGRLPSRLPRYFDAVGIAGAISPTIDASVAWRLASFSIWLDVFEVDE